MKTIIFDIDGTLADVTHRRHHVASKPKNWPAFFAAMSDDPPIRDVVDLCQFLSLGEEHYYGGPPSLRIVFCSGRGEEYRAASEAWLKKYVRPFGTIDLRMRPAGDSRSDVIIKKEMLDRLRAEGHDIWFVVDDRQRVVDMWRENGVTVLQCAPGDFDTAGDTYAHEYEAGDTPLRLMVGPSGAGKTTYVATKIATGEWPRDCLISSDGVREQMFGDFRNQSDNRRVFSFVHTAAKARLDHGLPVVIDATHLRRQDRLAAVALAPKGTRVEYLVFDRPLVEKLRDGGWRCGVMIGGQNLVERYHQVFQSAKRDIMRGDGLEHVVVTDLRHPHGG